MPRLDKVCKGKVWQVRHGKVRIVVEGAVWQASWGLIRYGMASSGKVWQASYGKVWHGADRFG